MTIPESTLQATICVALKSVSKDLRAALLDNDWQKRELAEREIAKVVRDSLRGFEISSRPANIPPARSAEQQLRDVYPDHDADEAMAVIRKTAL